MKRQLYLILIMLVMAASCRNEAKKTESGESKVTPPVESGLILIGKDIITEVIVTPDTLGDPWEVEKVTGYDGMAMYRSIFGNAYDGKLRVYNILTEEPINPGDLRSLERDFGSDYSKIGKLQFIEDWYFDPSTNALTKRVKSVSFGYESKRQEGLPPSYKALFKIMPEE